MGRTPMIAHELRDFLPREDLLPYLEAALLTAWGTGRLLAAFPFASATMHDGIYVPQGIVAACSRLDGVRVVTWNAAYRRSTFLFSHDDTYHHTLLSEPVEAWEGLPWTAELDARLMTYLESRREGREDWIVLHRSPTEAAGEVLAGLGVDRDRPLPE